MRIVACEHEGHLQAITTKPPLSVDLVAEEGAPLSVTFSFFDDPVVTNLRGLWRPWSEYEQGEVVYVTPEGPESGDTSEHTPEEFGAWVALRRTQHSEPGQPQSHMFWVLMRPMDLAGKTVWFVTPGNPSLETQCTISGGNVSLVLTANQTSFRPSSLQYLLEIREGASVAFYAARGQIIFRNTSVLEVEPEAGTYPEEDIFPEESRYPGSTVQ